MALWGSGVRIPSAPVFARVADESEDCRAAALAKADTFHLATHTQRATTRQAKAFICHFDFKPPIFDLASVKFEATGDAKGRNKVPRRQDCAPGRPAQFGDAVREAGRLYHADKIVLCPHAFSDYEDRQTNMAITG